MIRWIPYVFVRIVLFFMLGICLGIYYPDILPENYFQLLFLILVLLYCFLATLAWQQKFLTRATALKFYAGFVGLTAVFLAGYLNVLSSTDIRKQDHIIHITAPIEFYKAVVTSSPNEKNRSWKIEVDVEFVKSGGEWIKCQGNIILYCSKENLPAPFQYGDVLLIQGQPQLVSGPGNPEEFDYKRFLSFKNTYHQHYIPKDHVKRIGFLPRSWLEYYALLSRRWADGELKKHISGEREQSVSSALVLGVTDGLDNELLSAYKATGAMHVLAVSGLHVSIIYGLLLLILKPLNRVKNGPWLLAVISIVLLWVYAFITGLSPSVLRAVTMFSFVALAKPGAHRTNIYNTLAASAFCILMYNPYLIMSVGFQLSYVAVLGIVYLQSGIYNLWEPTNRVWDEIWKVSSVSIAAQLATFAIGLLYFHQFPNYFLLSNLFVIPGSFIVLILGLVVLGTGFIQPVAALLGLILEWIIKALNYIVFTLEEFPFSLIENVYITTFQCWLLIAIIGTAILLIQTRKFTWLITVSILGIIFSVSRWHHFQQDVNIQKLTIYNVRGHTAIDFMDRGQTFFIADSALFVDTEKIPFHITPHRIRTGVSESIHSGSAFQQELEGCSFMVWKGKSFLRIYDKKFSFPANTSVDFVIISNNAIRNLAEVSDLIKTDQLIFDSSNSVYSTSKLLEQMKAVQLKGYSVLHHGAFELYI